MIIKITQKDIEKGQINPYFCPLALVLRRIYTKKTVEVTWQSFWLNDIHYNIPLEITKWLKKFDAKEKVSPISFEMDLP